MIQTKSAPRPLIRPQFPARLVPPPDTEPAPPKGSGFFRIAALILIGTMTLVCHPCHGEDVDDELVSRDWWITSSR